MDHVNVVSVGFLGSVCVYVCFFGVYGDFGLSWHQSRENMPKICFRVTVSIVISYGKGF